MCSRYDDEVDYRCALAVFRAVKEIPGLKRVIPQLVRAEDMTITVTRRRVSPWPILDRLHEENLDLATLIRLNEQLRNYVTILRESGKQPQLNTVDMIFKPLLKDAIAEGAEMISLDG